MSMEISHFIAKEVRSRRKKMGLSQEELAFRSELNPKYIGMIERAERNITAKKLSQIVEVLETTLSDFFKGL